MSARLKGELTKLLDVAPFLGPTPGSNAASYLQIPTSGGAVDGSDVESLVRIGWMRTEELPTHEKRTIEAGDNDVGAPDVEITHAYFVSDEGRRVLKEEA